MIYSNFWKERRVPTLLALLVLTLSTSAGIVVIQEPILPFLKAAPDITPTQIAITNLTDSVFTVSWITATATTGLVKYGNNNQTQLVARDSRDSLTGNLGDYTTHWVTVSGLTPNSSFAFIILSAGHAFDNNGSPYQITTAPSLSPLTSTQSPIFGVVVTPDHQPATGALVYLRRAEDLFPQSTLVRSTGEWIIDLSFARHANLNQLFVSDPQSPVELLIQGPKQTQSTVTATIANAQPLPEIILGQDYNPNSLTVTPTPIADFQSRFDFAPLNETSSASPASNLVIWNPQAGAISQVSQPLFLGSAPPQTTLTIVVESTSPITDTLVADDRGYWQWSPPENLTPGVHTLTVSYTDTQERVHQAVRQFTVLAAEKTLVATDSPTLQPTSSPTSNIPSPTPSPAPATPKFNFSLPVLGLTGIGLVLIGLGIIMVL